jgi:hypothetical protein
MHLFHVVLKEINYIAQNVKINKVFMLETLLSTNVKKKGSSLELLIYVVQNNGR